MQRFRRSRSESKKRNKEDKPSSSRASSTISRTPSHSSSQHDLIEDSTSYNNNGMMMSRSTSQSSSLSLLPEPEEFRTSLILPHLTARFELLRGNDGQLVDLETLTSHLDEQRKTGRLTRFEMDSVLQQYKLQQGLEANRHPLPVTSTNGGGQNKGKKKKRIDWSGIDLEKLSKEQQQNSFPPPQLPNISTTSTSLRPNSNSFLSPGSIGGVGSSPTSSLNSFMSFLPESTSPQIPQQPPALFSSSSSSPQLSSSSTSLNSSSPNLSISQSSQNHNYLPRRGNRNEGGSLFGSRVGGTGTSSSSSTGMVKSLSGGSLASKSSARSKKGGIVVANRDEREQDEDDAVSDVKKGREKEKERFEEEIFEREGETLSREGEGSQREEGEEGESISRQQRRPEFDLTKSQIKRISTALDSLQVELSKTLSTGLRGGETGITTEEEEEEGDFESRFKDQDEEDLEQAQDQGLPRSSPTRETKTLTSQRDSFIRDPNLEQESNETFLTNSIISTASPPPLPVDDTEPIDPFYHSTLQQASQTPLPPSSSISSSLHSTSQTSSTPTVPAPDEEEDATTSFLPTQSPSTLFPRDRNSSDSSTPQRLRQYTSETDTTETPSTPNGTTGSFSKAFSVFPFVPNREEFPLTTTTTDHVEVAQAEEEEVEEEQGDETLMAIDVQDETTRPRSRIEEEEEDRNLTEVVTASSIPLPLSTSTSLNSISENITSSSSVHSSNSPPSPPPPDTRQPQQRDSLISNLSSTGSSFHEALESVPSPSRDLLSLEQREEDDEIRLPDSEEGIEGIRESKLLEELPPPTAGPPLASNISSRSPVTVLNDDSREEEEEGEEGTRLLSNLDRLPSSELIALLSSSSTSSAVANKEGGGGGRNADVEDIALEDLVLIQQALVRRAEEKKKKRLESMRGGGGDEEQEEQESIIEGEEEDDMVESIRESELAGQESRKSMEGGEEHRLVNSDDEDEEDDVDSSRGMGSRKDSAESEITSTGAFDFGDELSLSGLGLTSLASSKRASKRKSQTTTRIDTTSFLGGPQSSRMELQTSQSSSSPGFTNSAITPSTTQSDAFEFSSLAGSPDTASWIEQREEHEYGDEAEQEDEEGEGEEGPLGFSRSPAMHDLSIDHETAEDINTLEDSPELRQDDEEQQETEDPVGALPPSSETTEPAPSTTFPLGAPVQLEKIDNPSTLRVPRNMPRRDPASTTSMLIRDVRNQATLATFALKKTPTSPPSRSLTKKSIRKVSISSPHLVSAPVDMATVPIVPSPNLNDNNSSPSSSRSPRGNNNSKVSRSKTRGGRDGIDGTEGSKSRGLGSRFKSLLKKQSRDHLSLNGDEITPFVDRPSTDRISHPIPLSTTTSASASGPPPITPPNQDIARFSSTPGSIGPRTPTNIVEDPTTPLAKPTISSMRSPPRRPPPPSLDVVEELAERSPPPTTNNNNPVVPPSPALSTQSGRESRGGGLNRFVSRLRKSPVPPTTPPRQEESTRDATSSAKTSLDTTDSRLPLGLGIETLSPAHESYDRSPSVDEEGSQFPPPVFVAKTAPLSVGRNSQQGFSFPPQPESASSSRSGSGTGGTRHSRGGSGSVTRTSGHPVRASTDSMQRLWEAAEDLGLPPDKVQELVDSAYAQSPTTSPIRSGSMSSSFEHRSKSTGSPRRQHSSASQSRQGGSISSHARHTSETPSSHRRQGSNASSRSLQDRVPTPPPGSRHRRKASLASSREAGPVPDRPTSSYLPPSSSAGSRLSVSGSQYPPPASPSLGSIISSRQSGYADSFLDFYAQASDDYDSEIPPVPPLSSQHASERSLASNSGDYADRTLRANVGQGQKEEEDEEDHDEVGGEVVWQVLSDLRNNRLSTISKDSSFGFDSRDSSFEVEHGASEGNNSSDRSESIANMLRHRDRKRSSASMPPFQAGRFPSIYVRDEQKLLDLGQHGGVASEQQGHFFVRPKDASDEAQQPPPLPDEYRQLIASASSRHAPTTQPSEQDNGF
ncbi:hypothetical protein JCM5350_007947 [Sporobolomyces pararoseus]